KSGFYYGSLKDGFTLLAPYGKGVSAKTKQLIAQQKALIESGKWNEFTGPLYDQSGKLRVKKGQRLTVKQLYAIDWLVKGVVGSAKGYGNRPGGASAAPGDSHGGSRHPPRDHEAVPRRRRQRPRRLRGGGGRGPRAPR